MKRKISNWYVYGGGEELVAVLAVFLVAVLVISGVAFGVAYGIDKPSCYARTDDIGFESRWSFMGGCQILVEDGKWIPLSNYYFEQP